MAWQSCASILSRYVLVLRVGLLLLVGKVHFRVATITLSALPSQVLPSLVRKGATSQATSFRQQLVDVASLTCSFTSTLKRTVSTAARRSSTTATILGLGQGRTSCTLHGKGWSAFGPRKKTVSLPGNNVRQRQNVAQQRPMVKSKNGTPATAGTEDMAVDGSHTSADYYFDSYAHFGIHEEVRLVYPAVRAVLHLQIYSMHNVLREMRHSSSCNCLW